VPFSVAGVLEAVHDIIRPIAEEKRLAVRLLPPTLDERLGHPVALSRVLLNLTTNALKFTDKGYVEIVTQELANGRVEFSVRDSGKGIDPAIVATLYQPLRHATGRSGKFFSQTGLGLTICRKLAEAMGSELQVETRAGWGTRFFLVLDLPACPTRRRPATPGAAEQAGRSRRTAEYGGRGGRKGRN
jgi:signal transduction histidine kinase